MENKIVVCIPCYNCEKQIPRVVLDFDKGLLDRIEKVVLIDNRSSDLTIESAQSAILNSAGPDKFIIYKNDKNYGLGGTHKVAFFLANKENADYIAILHGDNQAKTGELHLLIDSANRFPEYSAILGARFMKGSKRDGYSKIRTVGNIGLNLLYSIVCGHKIKDLGSGINLFRVSDLEKVEIRKCSDSFTFNMDLLLGFLKQGLSILYVPITWTEADQISNAKTFKVGLIALVTLLKWRFGNNKTSTKYTNIENYSCQHIK